MTGQNISKFGKRFIVEASGTSLSDREKILLERLQPAGIILRSRNFLQDKEYEVWLERYQSLLAQIKQILTHQKIIISIDHEGGRVIRPPSPITKFPYAAKWTNSAKEVAKAMATELKSLAINIDYAPVADIHSNPQNPVIGQRSFGTSASAVTKAACEFARTIKANGITPCAKHFPGHGDTKTDSHFGVPVLGLSLDELKERELLPFQALVNENVQIIMTAHVLFSKIDPENTATLSKKILHDLLRDEMGFKGIVIADALGMAAISGSLSKQETVIKAVNASLDLFLIAGDTVTIEHAVTMAELLDDAVTEGKIKHDILEASEKRIDKFISSLPQHKVARLDSNIFTQHQKLADKLSAQAVENAFELNVPGFD